MKILLINLAVAITAVILLWLLSMPLKDVSIIDRFWGPGFVIIALITYLYVDGDWSYQRRRARVSGHSVDSSQSL